MSQKSQTQSQTNVLELHPLQDHAAGRLDAKKIGTKSLFKFQVPNVHELRGRHRQVIFVCQHGRRYCCWGRRQRQDVGCERGGRYEHYGWDGTRRMRHQTKRPQKVCSIYSLLKEYNAKTSAQTNTFPLDIPPKNQFCKMKICRIENA